MPNPVKVTFLFNDDEQFHHFLEDNKIDVYTYNWKKHEYLVDLSVDVKASMPSTGSENLSNISLGPTSYSE